MSRRRALPGARTWIALLRGVNVVGRRSLPMKELALMLQRAGLRSVRTYIQSGNVVFRSGAGDARTLAARIARLIGGRFGFEPQVVVLSSAELAAAIRGNPFAAAAGEPRSLHLFFLSARAVKPDLAALARLRTGGEGFALKGSVFYLHTPGGFAQSKLRAKVERSLGVQATARNWRSVNRLLAMAQETRSAEERGARATGLSTRACVSRRTRARLP
jgi:uncharacterized protein (DUF1697 family)